MRDCKPEPMSPEGLYRYADLLVDRGRERLICVREDHTGVGEPENALVAVGFDGKVVVLSSGADFYAAPRLSPNGEDIAWVQWRHPNMPWDETELMLSGINEAGHLTEAMCMTGAGEAVFQPEFGPDGSLFYVSDRNGWWNLYRLGVEGDACVYAIEAEFGLPHWVFGTRNLLFQCARPHRRRVPA